MKSLLFCMVLMSLTLPAWASDVGLVVDHANLWLTLVSFFFAGLMLAFTPCVLPMIPILSGILTGQDKITPWRSLQLSAVFVLGMAFTYALAGIAAGFLGSTIQTSLQLPGVIIGFSMIFVLMALSMFGVFELNLPTFFLNRMLKVNNRLAAGTIIGVALMGALSTLIASPCVTAPMLSVLVYIGQTGNPVIGGLILFVLALGMGTPLMFFAIGHGSLLPKTGPWMIRIKQFFGVVMLGMAIWMLSRLLPGNITLFLFASLCIVSGIAFGAFHFRVQSGLTKITHGLSFLLVIYGVILMVGAASGQEDWLQPLKPKMTINKLSMNELFEPITNLKSLEEKLAQAKNRHKPVLIDFYADWCPDCQALDKNVFANKDVQNLMQGFTVIRVDISKNNAELAAIRARYHIYGIPSIIFYNKQGEVLPFDVQFELTRNNIKQKLMELQ